MGALLAAIRAWIPVTRRLIKINWMCARSGCMLIASRDPTLEDPMPIDPLVSIIIPCYNGEAYIRDAIDSALTQSYPHVEIVVVDDGSTDQSGSIIHSYADRLIGIRHSNQGLPRSRNAGVARSRGEYLLFLDCDDLIAPDTVAALLAAVKEGPDTVACCKWRTLVQKNGAWIAEASEVPFPLPHPDPLAGWLLGQWIPCCSFLWPRKLFNRLGGFDGELTTNEDGDLMYRALLRGTRLAVARGGESYYRRHGTNALSMSRDIFSEHRVRSSMRAFEKLETELHQHDLWDSYKIPLGIAYQMLAHRAFSARTDLAREALERGVRLAGKRAVSPTRLGRVLVRLIGMERKERTARALAQLGLMSSGRRQYTKLGRLHRANSP
ncbi:MAG: glycosyltransferase [Mesorhizobium sp.]|nr:MAG: glycosyltransferase [Mesorhizobium sp.]